MAEDVVLRAPAMASRGARPPVLVAGKSCAYSPARPQKPCTPSSGPTVAHRPWVYHHPHTASLFASWPHHTAQSHQPLGGFEHTQQGHAPSGLCIGFSLGNVSPLHSGPAPRALPPLPSHLACLVFFPEHFSPPHLPSVLFLPISPTHNATSPGQSVCLSHHCCILSTCMGACHRACAQ